MLSSLFCKHDWEFIKEVEIYDPQSWSQNPIEIRHVYVCKKCLKTKKIKL